MKKSQLLRAIQNEIQRHNLSTFMSKEHKIVQTGLLFLPQTFRHRGTPFDHDGTAKRS
jgi:hypothetical protein